MKRLCQQRKDVKLILMSATLDTSKFLRYFPGSHSFHIVGRSFPVTVLYSAKSEKSFVEVAVQKAMDIHLQEPLGHILCFLTGQEDIERACTLLGEKLDAVHAGSVDMLDVVILPVYAQLPAYEQQKMFAPCAANTRKILFTTNVSETSLTVDGIVYVIDAGFVKQKVQ